MPRKPRNSNRGTIQHVEDAFCDLSLAQQERMIETLTGLHRQAVRMSRAKAGSPVDPQPSAGGKRESGSTGDDAHAAGRAAYFDAIGQPDPAKNAALDLPEDPKQ